MMSGKNHKVVFEVMVTFPHLLLQRIADYNKEHETDFELIEIIEDEVEFCKIGVSQFNYSDIFDLGYSLAAQQYSLKIKGELDW